MSVSSVHHDFIGRAESPLTLRIAGMTSLSAPERAVLRDVSVAFRSMPAQTMLCPINHIQAPLVLMAGWACYKRLLRDGRRQIIRFLLPGDLIGSLLQPDRLPTNAALSLTPVTLGDGRALQRVAAGAEPGLDGLQHALRQIDYSEIAGLSNHIVRLGRQTAYERVVHLMLEFHSRLAAVGQVRDGTFNLPLTQEILADALGLSVVHINRTLQQVRRDRLFDMRGGQVTLRQIDLMQAVADWAPDAA